MSSETQINLPEPDFLSEEGLPNEEVNTGYTEQDIRNVRAIKDIALRERYAQMAFDIVRWWILGLAGVILLQGLSTSAFHLSDSIMIALISSATAGVLGLPIIVLHNLFPSKKK